MKSKGWIIHRLGKLHDEAPTSEVSGVLKIPMATLLRWAADRHFQSFGVAEKRGGRWLWDIAKLEIWLHAVAELGCKKTLKKAVNPPQMSREEARRMIGMPDNYSMKGAR